MQRNSLDLYMQDMGRLALLTADQEMWLSIQIRAKALVLEMGQDAGATEESQRAKSAMHSTLAVYGRCLESLEQLTAALEDSSCPAPDMEQIFEEVEKLRNGQDPENASYVRSYVEMAGWQTMASNSLFELVLGLYLLPNEDLSWLREYWQEHQSLANYKRYVRRTNRPGNTNRLAQNEANIIEAGKHAESHFTSANLRLVAHVAKKFRYSKLPFDDLLQEGNIGLMRAVTKFDHTLGHKFGTYATWWIKQAISRAIADQARVIRLPVHYQASLTRLAHVQQRYLQEEGIEPTQEQLALEMGLLSDLEVQQIKEMVANGQPVDPLLAGKWVTAAKSTGNMIRAKEEVLSLESPVHPNGEGSVLQEIIADNQAADPAQVASMSMLRESVTDLLEILSEREKNIIIMRFGLAQAEPMTLEQTGKYFDITRERVRQIEAKALRKLRYSSQVHHLRGGIS